MAAAPTMTKTRSRGNVRVELPTGLADREAMLQVPCGQARFASRR